MHSVDVELSCADLRLAIARIDLEAGLAGQLDLPPPTLPARPWSGAAAL